MSSPTEGQEVEGSSLSKEAGCEPPEPPPPASDDGGVVVGLVDEDDDPPPHPATTTPAKTLTATNAATRTLTASIQDLLSRDTLPGGASFQPAIAD
jgi:hypothetical protein